MFERRTVTLTLHVLLHFLIVVAIPWESADPWDDQEILLHRCLCHQVAELWRWTNRVPTSVRPGNRVLWLNFLYNPLQYLSYSSAIHRRNTSPIHHYAIHLLLLFFTLAVCRLSVTNSDQYPLQKYFCYSSSVHCNTSPISSLWNPLHCSYCALFNPLHCSHCSLFNPLPCLFLPLGCIAPVAHFRIGCNTSNSSLINLPLQFIANSLQ
jgi:hypothetical protein